MKKLAKLALAAAAVAMAVSAYTQSVPYGKKAVNDNWGNGMSEWAWKDDMSELCWRSSFWTPATANAQCDGVLVLAAAPAAAPAAPAAPVVPSEKVTFAADILFGFNKTVLKPEGKAKLDDLISKLNGINLEVVITAGHIDSFGSSKYNDRLSVHHTETVKGHLVNKSIEANHACTGGKGKCQLRVDPKSCKGARKVQIACQQPNHRVDVGMADTRRAQQAGPRREKAQRRPGFSSSIGLWTLLVWSASGWALKKR